MARRARLPGGAVKLARGAGEVLPTNCRVGTYKGKHLAALRNAGLILDDAFGNASTDIDAYERAGIVKARTWIIGPNAGQGRSARLVIEPRRGRRIHLASAPVRCGALAPSRRVGNKRSMFAFAALCAAVYLAAQTMQLVVTRAFAPAAGSPLDTLRATAILLSMFGVVPIHVAVALRRFRHAPGAAVCGVVFGALFVAFELAYRSIELLAPPIAGWSELVNAWYFPLLAVHLASSIAFTVACWPRAGDERWDALAAAAFGLNALRLVARLLGGYAGVAPLAAFSGPLYFPATATVMSLLVVWLVRQAALARASLNGAAR